MTKKTKGSVVTIGTFDGVHRGHQKLLRKTARLAKEEGLGSKVFTFTAPPKVMLNGKSRSILIPFPQKVHLLNEFVDQVIVADFEKIKDFSPEKFVHKILIETLHVSHVVIGHDWQFGRGKSGTAEGLEKIGGNHFTTHILDPLLDSGLPVSSTRIRKNLSKGEIERATDLLGRHPTLYGRIVKGEKIGTEMGFPTANLCIGKNILIPKHGIYAARTRVQGEIYPGALYIGNRPTFDGEQLRVEVHLLTEKDVEIYGTEMEVELIHYLREDREFSDREKLAKQIEKDVNKIKDILEIDSINRPKNSYIAADKGGPKVGDGD